MDFRPVGRAAARLHPPGYAGSMEFLVILVLLIGAVVAYRMRVPLLAKILGQPGHRIERRLNQRKK